VREILNDAVTKKPFGERTSKLRGALRLERGPEEPWRRELRRRNWRE
jgi:hypothetical protein